MSLSSLLAAPARRIGLCGQITYLTGESVPFSGGDALSFSLSEGGGFLLGGAFSAACTLTLNDADGVFAFRRAPYGAQVQVDLTAGEERAPLCAFTVSRVSRRENAAALTLSGCDAMGTAFEAAFTDDFAYPLPLGQLARRIAAQAGFPLADDFPNADVEIAARPDWGEITLRKALAFVACAAGCFACIGRDGALRLKPAWPGAEAPFSITPAVTLRREYGDRAFGPLTGLSIACQGAPEDTPPLTVSTDDTPLIPANSLSIAGNPLFAHGAAHALPLARGLLNTLQGMALHQARVSWRGDPALTLGDPVRLTDTRGDAALTLVTRQTLSFFQGFSMQTDSDCPAAPAPVGRLFSAGGALNAAALSGPVDGALLRAGSVAAGAIAAGAVSAQHIATQAVTAGKIAAGAVTADTIAAGAVSADHLSAAALSAMAAHIQRADIDWASISALNAATAQIAAAQIAGADIDLAHVKDLAADSAVITRGVGGQLYIARLAVTEANLVSLTVGELLVRGQDGGFYAVQVDAQGQIATTRKQVSNADVTDLSINADTKLIEGSVTAKTLNAQQVFADSALIRQLIAANLDVDTLFARAATVQALNAADISGNQSLQLHVRQAVSALENRTAAAEAAIQLKADAIDLGVLQTRMDDLSVGGRNLLPGGAQERASTRFLSIPVREALLPYVGQSVCVSFDIKGAVSRPMRCYAYQDSGVSIADRFDFTVPTDDFHRFSFVTTVLDYGQQAGLSAGALAFYDDAGEQSYTVRRVKIELGTLPTDWTPAPEDAVSQVDNASVRIDPTGVTMRGGAMRFQAGSAFEVQSGGTFNVFAADDSSQIIFGGTAQSPHFSLGAGGTVKAVSVIADHLSVKDTDVVAAVPGSLASRIIVSDSQPSGHGILWFHPSAVSAVDFILPHSAGEDMSGQNLSRTLSGFARQGSALAGSACTYGVKSSIYNYQGACQWTRVTVQVRRADGTGSAVTILDDAPNRHVGVGDYFSVDTLSSPSAALENLTDASDLSLIVTLQRDNATYARFEVDQPFILRCANASAPTAQACDVKYIP